MLFSTGYVSEREKESDLLTVGEYDDLMKLDKSFKKKQAIEMALKDENSAMNLLYRSITESGD